MSQTFLKRRLTQWGSALLVACVLPACSSSAPTEKQGLTTAEARPATQAAVRPSPPPSAAPQDFAADEGGDARAKTESEPSRDDRALKAPRGIEAELREAPAPEPMMAVAGPSSMKGGGAVAGGVVGRVQEGEMARRAPTMSPKKIAAIPTEKDVDGSDTGGPQQGNTFEAWKPNTFTETSKDPLSTFAADVDTASYTVARRYLQNGNLPPSSAVRVEEFVNYFKYRYTPPETGAFTVHLEAAPSPFDSKRHFVRVGVQGKVVSRSQRKPAHLVFLVDTSGSMASQDKLPLAKEAIKIAVKNLNENDTVAIVTYAGSTREVLTPTPATDVKTIHAALDTLQSGGGTAMGTGMELAYKHAVKKASGKVVSRVIVLTDGDANIGPTLSPQAMLESIHKYVAEGVTLTAVGFGMGNYRDDMMEKLADKGNGNCFYVDSYKEAKKVFETQLTGTLEVIAKDVKLQVEFNPAAVRRYRLMGYENRDVADNDFRNDKVDAGEIGAGHNVTALYEVELVKDSKESLATVRVRAKAPNGTEAAEQSFPFERSLLRASVEASSPDFRFALAVASTADILRGNPAAEAWSLATAQKLAEGAAAGDADRNEFVKLVSQARALSGASARGE
ncbi:vWA domain-containing protein [Myxococcus qinghaiensis]|uniref:vWA domain-containing protein n=1 Tax=Myxococcus qinghaiensis TaxID=2906758 RepID=UPI0020A8039C|nr:von Willebrand factor type A domain-containing protein [Myxococcus qinghaiensis]MCP3166519.1 von Willebrand factor type A domain-containing protein [Myxococcus qinghaiensis]